MAHYKFNFRLVKSLQRVFIRSLFARLISVNYVLNILDYQNYFSSEEKFRATLNLRYPFFSKSIDSFYIQKKKGYSIFFSTSSFYYKSLQSLYNFSILPYMEGRLEKPFYGIRPFRDCRDTFLEIKNFLISSRKDYSVLRFSLSKSKSFFNNSFLFNIIPFDNKILKSWLYQDTYDSEVYSSNDFQNPFLDLSNFNYTLFDIALNGLV